MKEMIIIPRWMKIGILFTCVYLALIILIVIGAVLGIGGHGEDNIFGWLIIFSGYPLVWLLNIVGIKAKITDTSIFLWPVFQMGVLFLIGALFGLITSKRNHLTKNLSGDLPRR
jgi:hypothetical protein